MPLGTGMILLWALGAADAWVTAKRLQRGEHVTDWQFF